MTRQVQKPGAPSGPAIAATSDKQFECVFVKQGDEAKLRVVKTGIQNNTFIEITDGLAVDEMVITGPYTTVTKNLNAGDKVEVASKTKRSPKIKNMARILCLETTTTNCSVALVQDGNVIALKEDLSNGYSHGNCCINTLLKC